MRRSKCAPTSAQQTRSSASHAPKARWALHTIELHLDLFVLGAQLVDSEFEVVLLLVANLTDEACMARVTKSAHPASLLMHNSPGT